MTPPNEKEWLATRTDHLRKYIGLIFTEYDEGRLTRSEADARIGIMCKDDLTTTYDRAFTRGLESAELDGDSEEEIDFNPDLDIEEESD